MASRLQGADNRDLTTHAAVEGLLHATGKLGPWIAQLSADLTFRLRRWREDRRTWAALRHLDNRQLRELGIYPRPPDLTNSKFP